MSEREAAHGGVQILRAALAHADKRADEHSVLDDDVVSPRREGNAFQQSLEQVALQHQLRKDALSLRPVADDGLELHCVLRPHSSTSR